MNLVPPSESTSRSTNLSFFELNHIFKWPLSWLKSASGIGITQNSSPYQTFQNGDTRSILTGAPKEAELIINAGIGGHIVRPTQVVSFVTDTGTEKDQEVELEPAIIAKGFSVGS